MCEIAVVDPDRFSPQGIHQTAGVFHEEQGDGLGVLAVKNEGDSFSYTKYKSVEPHWQTLFAFLNRNWDTTWRFVVHGRAMTTGEVNRETAHPISINCDECEFDHVIHNGHVKKSEQKRSNLEQKEHSFNTEVDTEVIPHEISQLPETVEDHSRATYSFHGNLNYIVFSEDGILVRVSDKYHLDDEFTMTCRPSLFNTPEEYGLNADTENEWMLIRPDGADPDIETKERVIKTASGTYGSRWPSVSGSTRKTSQSTSTARTVTTTVDEDHAEVKDDTHTIRYKDLSEWEHIVAFRVAPGVIKVIDENEDEQTFVYRQFRPKLYYWYAPEEEPDNMDKLVERAEMQKRIRSGKMENLDDAVADRASEAVADEVTTTIAENVDALDNEDLDEVRDEVMAAAHVGTRAAVTAENTQT